MGRFIIKHIPNTKPQKQVYTDKKVIKEGNTMTTSEKVAMAQEVLGAAPAAKRIKKDKGLIERSESTKTIITEDNKELLND